ncbi:Hint domain-containing protein [Rhodovulum imhoffii]|uniref:Hint domain-containing protein n=1 Tax=Rhodovulum imhoffii TaxID=365340 RepID=A0A2T5BT29_9RHOB|nr:Hint domain-containing protein [Rhodovulum imhoffii]MBK5932670.1 hypothetical protein [Rhodovulum imhoffii]PTN02514.1 Hint domain-containing protein [Rhodovulum imhoffii]
MADLTYTSGSATDYANALLGKGITLVSASLIGSTSQSRIYTDGDAQSPTVTPTDTGLIFSTGLAESFNDDDTTNDELDSFIGSGGDSDLSNEVGSTTRDASGIVITFTADKTGTIDLSLTFLSDEYPDYFGSRFNDVAGVFVNGALVPITDTVNGYYAVNDMESGGSFFDNGETGDTNTYGTDFNAFRSGVASFNVVEGQTYTLKIVVADIVDRKFDSALMVGSGAVKIVCFTEGTMIQTRSGPVAVEDLSPGDMVLTKDRGYQPLRWSGATRLSAGRLSANPHLRAIRIRAGALGAGMPGQDLTVSPQHRVLVRSRIAERMFTATEVLVPAKALLPLEGVEVVDDGAEVSYFHLLFDQHEIIFANGAETESLYLGETALESVGREARREIQELFPDLRTIHPDPVRPLATVRRARTLAERHLHNAKPICTSA